MTNLSIIAPPAFELAAVFHPTPVNKRKTLFDLWRAMMWRCYGEDCNGYERYGGRGIIVCERWHDFETFLRDVGPRPEPHPTDGRYTLDRIDNDGNYEPDNVRWATWKEQRANQGKG